MQSLGKALVELAAWKRKQVPFSHTAFGDEVLIWLMQSKQRPRGLKDLYKSSRFSEPTLRNCLRAYKDEGYILIETSDDDMRNRLAVATPKLEQMLSEYRDKLAGLARAAVNREVFDSGRARISTASSGSHGADPT